MRRLFKTLLLWLLLAALPIQGIAAAAMMSCRSACETIAPAGPANATSTSIPSGEEQAIMDHAGRHEHHHHATAQMADHVLLAHDHGQHHASHDHSGHASSTSCSACAACCIGAAPLPFGIHWADVYNDSEPVLISPASFMTGFIPSGIERPPRFTFI